MYKTLTDLKYSKSPECPFIVDESSIAEIRSRLDIYENKNTLLSPDAQVGARKSIAAALRKRKLSIPGGKIPAIVYPYDADVERIAGGLRGPRRPSQTSSPDEIDNGSGTMSMDLGTEDGTSLTPSEWSSPSKAVGSRICEEVAVGVEVGCFAGKKL
jgi:hypothetical protein